MQDMDKTGSYLYHMRYIIALVLLLFLTIGRFHGDSMAAYDYYIQPGIGNENLYPVMGEARIVRSDEWVVSTPAKLASSFGETPFTKYNEIQRGTNTLNILNGVEINAFSVIRNPFILGWLILDRERAFSLNWYATIFVAFLVSMEFFCIIGNRSRLIAVTGACLTVFSSFYLWWGFPTMIWSLEACIVCAYYLLHQEKLLYKVFFAAGFVSAFLNFATPLYPAWQVPFGFVALMLVIWMIHEHWDLIRQQKKSTWLIVSGAVAVIVILTGLYFLDISEYVKAISTTVYPGKRSDFGGYFLNKLFYYFQAIDYAYKDLGLYSVGATASEKSAFLSFFPLPTIVGALVWFRNKKENWLLGLLLLLEIPMLFYVTTGLPGIVAKVLLFSLSTRIRMIDVIGFIQVIFICYLAGREYQLNRMEKGILTFATVLSCVAALFICKMDYPDYMISRKFMLLVVCLLMLAGAGLFIVEKKALKRLALCICIVISLRTGWMIRPVMKGLDAIYEKPVAKEVMQIMSEDPDARWMTENMEFVCSGFLVACGAPTVNSVNTYPNMELWTELDPDGEYEEVYNRYAHVVMNFTEEDTSMELIAADSILVNLSYEDIEKTDVSYILTRDELVSREECSFEKIYDEAGCKIYHVEY